jgi:hypothetical protein
MPKRYLSRLAFWALSCWILLLAAAPASAEGPIFYVERVGRSFGGNPASVTIYTSIPDVAIYRVEKPVTAAPNRILLELQTGPAPGRRDPFAYRIDIPRLPDDGYVYLVVEGVDLYSAARTAYLDSEYMIGEALAHFSVDRKVLTSAETFTAGASFYASSGAFGGTWELAGDRVRIPLGIGCYWCSIPQDIEHFELKSPPVGPLPPGEYTVELVSSGGELVYHSEKVKVLAATPLLQDGRFTAQVLLDPPHGGTARLVDAPSRDSALFYFFSPDNWELMVKVLDGCALNGHFWVFGAASTDVGYTVVVRDLLREETREYRHAAGTPAPAIADSAAFACGPADEGAAR